MDASAKPIAAAVTTRERPITAPAIMSAADTAATQPK
jgi:hypothetical protein